MKLECTIGTQGMSDGRTFSRGDVYEVDDNVASALVATGNAKAYVEPKVAAKKSTARAPIAREHASHFGESGEESEPPVLKTTARGRKPKK